ncbi:acyltransferase family protein [Prosthecodimorpha staleyi]|uniref:Acyltransferase n=1 Tax=Prosthecodimorpha staleyi TaxID=2840188 RepID=A0A947GF04_9HYPH|nr:acyltransferase [Prosthecodimorpha staleyi]MBT9292592.1 acyltransferase [Prosthecodimorpha staleyi]
MAFPARLPGLDLLRIAAVLAVIAFHWLFRGPVLGVSGPARFPALEQIAVYGYFGVDLFFTLSGFVIAWSAEARDAIGFARARLLRLWPAFAVSASLTAVVLAWAADPGLPVTAAQWLANLTFLPHLFGQRFVDSAYWSIVVELVFYGWVFLALATGLWRRRPALLGWGWLALSAVNLKLGSVAYDRLVLASFAGEFLAGILLFRLWSSGPSAGRLAMLAAAMAVQVAHGMVNAADLTSQYGVVPDPRVVALLHLAIFALVALAVPLRTGATAARLFRTAGLMTYPAYLLHQNIGTVALARLAAAGIEPGIALSMTGAALLAASWLIATRVEPVGRRLLAALVDPLVARLPGRPP